MNTTTGGLIRMTAHMIRTEDARVAITFGILIAVLCAFLALCAALSRKSGHKWRWVLAFLGIALAGAAMAVSGAKQPLRKVLYCCASGPVNLEAVADLYDIIEVDGAFLKIVER